MTKEELIDIINTQSKKLNEMRQELELYTTWFSKEKKEREILRDKINAFKSLAKAI